jgi:holo-[acyl-carrier protein] synthase
MIVGVGIDIVDVKRMARNIEKPGFINHAFTPSEIEYCKQKAFSAEHYAARFAAKEAFFKAIGTGVIGDLDFRQVEVTNETNGKPNLELKDAALLIAEKLEIKNIHTSLSHEKDFATAIVILEK